MQDKIILIDYEDLGQPTGKQVYAKVPGDFSTTNYYDFEDFLLNDYNGSYEERYIYDIELKEIFYY